MTEKAFEILTEIYKDGLNRFLFVGPDYYKEKYELLKKEIYADAGSKTSEIKKKTSAENGKKGGRPKKKAGQQEDQQPDAAVNAGN